MRGIFQRKIGDIGRSTALRVGTTPGGKNKGGGLRDPPAPPWRSNLLIRSELHPCSLPAGPVANLQALGSMRNSESRNDSCGDRSDGHCCGLCRGTHTVWGCRQCRRLIGVWWSSGMELGLCLLLSCVGGKNQSFSRNGFTYCR